MADRVGIVVSGAGGRMGGTLARLAAADGRFTLVGGLDRDPAAGAPGYDRLAAPADAGELIRGAEVVIDFSAPAFLAELLDRQGEALAGRALVVGTTGLRPEEDRRLDAAAERSPVLAAANFSVGVNVLLSLVARAVTALGPGYDVEIVEAHHRRKEDAPSGTALALGRVVAGARGVELDEVRRDGRSGRPGARPSGEIGFHSLRGGSLVGEHEVRLIGEMDELALTHRAADRALFAAGALRAAAWLAGREPGRYSMVDVLGL